MSRLSSKTLPASALPPRLKFQPAPAKASRVHKAFILGAGLGNRLRPLTERLPKPLVPLFHRPLAAWAMDACAAAGIRDFALNTHHLPEAWNDFTEVPAGCELTLFHETALLETGGGLKNIESWIGDDDLLIHNGDIFSTLPLEQLMAAHRASGLPVTLAVRSTGLAKHIALDPSGSRVTDIHLKLGRAPGTHVFTGIYCVSPEFLKMIPAHEKISVIPAFLELARSGRLGAALLDGGVWLDLGDRASYLQAHRELALAPPVHPLARVEGATVADSVVGPGAIVAPGAVVRNSVIWPGCQVAAGAVLDRCIVFSARPPHGSHQDSDL
jgi:mannose-1-phosphate guanylyltransferase